MVGRALLALALMVFFYAFAAAVALLLFAIPGFVYEKTGRVHVNLLIGCWLPALLIVWSVIPRRERFEAPGPLLTEESCPALFRVIRQVAQRTEQEMPKEVYLLIELNAFVSQRGGFMGFFSRRIMGIGLPLLEVMTVPEFEAVLAHEFGHYRRGDTALGPWVYVTRESIIRTVENMSEGVVRVLFVAVGKLFLRITHAVSRQEEFAADAVAARAFGVETFAGALRKLETHGFAFSYYLENEWSPMLKAKVVVPMIEGYRDMLASTEVAAFLKRVEAERLEVEAKPDPYQTHPATEQRLAALAELEECGAAAGAKSGAEVRAISLLPDLAAAEQALCDVVLVKPKEGGTYLPVAWAEVLDVVYLPLWRERLKRYQTCLASIPVREAATLMRDRVRLEACFSGVLPRVTEKEWLEELRNVMGASLSLILSERGITGTVRAGKDISFVCGERTLYPFRMLETDPLKCPEPPVWEAICRETGIGGLHLDGTVIKGNGSVGEGERGVA